MGKFILVIEDNESDVMLLEHALEEAGMECPVQTINDGCDAQSYIADTRSEAAPALILLDLNMPKVDGISLLEDLRGSDIFRPIPVIAWSSTFSPKDAARIRSLGVVDLWVKPINLNKWRALGEMIKRLL